MDTVGNKIAAPEIAMIKVVAPKMCLNVVDRAIQVHGGAGLNSDLPLAGFFAWARALRFADGPDEVHLRAIARSEISKQGQPKWMTTISIYFLSNKRNFTSVIVNTHSIFFSTKGALDFMMYLYFFLVTGYPYHNIFGKKFVKNW